MDEPTLTCQRRHFDIPREVVYLNCAYLGPLSKRVIEAGGKGLARKAHPWTITTDDFFDPVDRARRLFAQLVGGDAEGVALVPSVSYGIGLAAANLPLSAGAEILLLEEQFPSNVYAWRSAAQRAGATIVTVPRPADSDWTTAILETVRDATEIVALPHCHWTDGGLLDLERIGDRVREVGAALVVDGCQSIGALPFDVGRIRPDFLVTSSYKWLLGPYSMGFLWAAPGRRDGRPFEQGWHTREGARNFGGLVEYTDEMASGARRYDVGETANFALLPAVEVALRQTLDWGVERIQRTLRALTDQLAEGATALGLDVASRALRSGHLLGLRFRGLDPQKLAADLAAEGIWVSVRGSSIRVAPHVYNDEDDIQRLVAALSGNLR